MNLEDRVREIVREEMRLAGMVPAELAQPAATIPQVPPGSVTPAPTPLNQMAPPASPSVATPPGSPAPVPPGPPQVSPPGPPVATPPQATAPMAPAAPVQGVPTLDDLRALANDLMRSKPEKATEFQAFLASKGTTSLADLNPQFYVETAAKFKELMGVA